MTITNWIGFSLCILPFAAIFLIAAQIGGVLEALAIFAATAVIVGVIGLGVYLATLDQ